MTSVPSTFSIGRNWPAEKRADQTPLGVRPIVASSHGQEALHGSYQELLWAKFDGLDAFESRVCWVDGFYGGLEFVRPM
jgi:hypothetical protein